MGQTVKSEALVSRNQTRAPMPAPVKVEQNASRQGRSFPAPSAGGTAERQVLLPGRAAGQPSTKVNTSAQVPLKRQMESKFAAQFAPTGKGGPLRTLYPPGGPRAGTARAENALSVGPQPRRRSVPGPAERSAFGPRGAAPAKPCPPLGGPDVAARLLAFRGTVDRGVSADSVPGAGAPGPAPLSWNGSSGKKVAVGKHAQRLSELASRGQGGQP